MLQSSKEPNAKAIALEKGATLHNFKYRRCLFLLFALLFFCVPTFAKKPTRGKAKVTFYAGHRKVADPRRHGSDPAGVAADPRYHPLGSVVYIEGFGRRIVDDTGGSIKGPHRFDIRLSSRSRCRRLGVKRLSYKVIKHASKKKKHRH